MINILTSFLGYLLAMFIVKLLDRIVNSIKSSGDKKSGEEE